MIPEEWTLALADAISLMEMSEIEPTSALRQCANDRGVEWGSQMQSFMDWANNQLFS